MNWTCRRDTVNTPAGCNLLIGLTNCTTQQNFLLEEVLKHQNILKHQKPPLRLRKKIDRRRFKIHNLGVETPSFPHLCLGGPLCVGALTGSRWWPLEMTLEAGSTSSLDMHEQCKIHHKNVDQTTTFNTTNNTHNQPTQQNSRPTLKPPCNILVNT